jgi:beta-glucosidase
LENGNIDGISPKLAMLMIGTNNAGSHKPEEIAEGVEAIVKKLRKQLPKTKVLILAIFPRGAINEDHLRKVNQKANKIIAKLADGKMVQYLDINKKFLTEDGTLTTDIMADLLHPGAEGYQIWAEAVEPAVAKVMGPLKKKCD